MNNKIETELIKLVKKAYKMDEVPVAAILVKNGKIIAKGFNKKNKTNNPLLHAEVVCISKGIKKLKDWRFEECELYVTLEPCDMCKKIIEETRIGKVYYICEKTDKIFPKTEYKQLDLENVVEYKNILKEFFKNKRG